MKIIRQIFPLLLALTLHAQTTPPIPPTWFTLLTPAQQSLSTTVGLPAGTTYRIGDTQNNKWSAPVTTTAAVTVVDYADGQDGRPADPDPGTAKEFDIQETATPQNVTVNGTSVTVPALPPPMTPAITWPPPASLAAGTPLSSTQLNATASVAGTFAYTPLAGALLLPAGTYALNVVFTPTDTVHYTTATASVPLVVTRTAVSTFTALCTNWSDTTFSCTSTSAVTPVVSQ
jgi:hypothetical protein